MHTHNTKHSHWYYLQASHCFLNSEWKPINWPAWPPSGPAAHLCCHWLHRNKMGNTCIRQGSLHDTGYVGALEFCPPQVNGNARFSQPAPCYNSGINIIHVLEGYSSWQVLMQMTMNLIKEFNGTNQEVTILWLDHIKAVAKKMAFNPLEIGMSKLKGMALCDVNAAWKEGTILYFWLCQLLIEHYSNVLQGENKLITQCITRAKVLLEYFHQNSKMCNIPGIGYNKLYLIWGLCSPHARRRAASEQDTWHSMKDVFQTIEHITRSKVWHRAFFNPNLETVKPIIQVNEVSYGKTTWHNKFDWSNSGQPHPVWFNNTFRDTSRHPRGSFKKAQDNSTTSTVQASLHATTVRESTWSRTASSLLKKNPGTSRQTQTWPGTTGTNSERLCRGVMLPSRRYHLQGHQRYPIAWNRWNS